MLDLPKFFPPPPSLPRKTFAEVIEPTDLVAREMHRVRRLQKVLLVVNVLVLVMQLVNLFSSWKLYTLLQQLRAARWI